MVCDVWWVDFDPFCVFLCFKVRCLWAKLWSTAAKNAIVRAAFELKSSPVCEKRSNIHVFLEKSMVVYLSKKLLQLYFSLSGHKHWLHIHQCMKKLGGIGSSSCHVRTCFFSLSNNVEYFGLFFYTWETFFTALKGKLEPATSTKKQNHH